MSTNQTKSRIISAAYGLFQEKGFERVTVKDICDACNITKPTFYYHLKSKDDIVLEYYDQIKHTISLNLMQILTEDNHINQIIRCFGILMDECERYGAEFFTQMLISNFKTDYNVMDIPEEYIPILASIIAKGQKDGELRNTCDAVILAQGLFDTFLGILTNWCSAKGTLDWRYQMRQYILAFLSVEPTLRQGY